MLLDPSTTLSVYHALYYKTQTEHRQKAITVFVVRPAHSQSVDRFSKTHRVTVEIGLVHIDKHSHDTTYIVGWTLTI